MCSYFTRSYRMPSTCCSRAVLGLVQLAFSSMAEEVRTRVNPSRKRAARKHMDPFCRPMKIRIDRSGVFFCSRALDEGMSLATQSQYIGDKRDRSRRVCMPSCSTVHSMKCNPGQHCSSSIDFRQEWHERERNSKDSELFLRVRYFYWPTHV